MQDVFLFLAIMMTVALLARKGEKPKEIVILHGKRKP